MTVPKLQPGDRVRFVSPASTPSRAAVMRGAELLQSWGLQVEVGQHAFDTSGYLAGADEDRLADLDDALRDPGVRAVFATRGGKGAYRIAAGLDLAAARADPKPVVGFSDITYLHLALHRGGAPVGFHGPMVNWDDDYYDSGCADALRRALMTSAPVEVRSDPAEYTSRFTSGERATGTLIGGNLDTLSRSVGWALPDLDGAILLVEDHHGTGLGQVDRCFAHLVSSRALDRVAGIAVGTFGEFETSEASGSTLEDVVSDWLDRLGVPVLGGLPLGHGRNPATVPLGTAAMIDPRSGTLTVAPGVH